MNEETSRQMERQSPNRRVPLAVISTEGNEGNKVENSGLNKETRSPGGNRFMASWVPYKKISTEGNKVENTLRFLRLLLWVQSQWPGRARHFVRAAIITE